MERPVQPIRIVRMHLTPGQQAKHRIVGYTGHTHGAQHVYGESVGKVTRRLHGGAANLDQPHTTYDLLNYKDKRPNYEDGNNPNCL